MTIITLRQAQNAVAAAISKSTEVGTLMNVAVIDQGGNLVAFAREDNGWLGSMTSASRTRARHVSSTSHRDRSGELSQPGRPLYNIELSNGGLISFPGGIPLRVAGEVVGAIGVSGSTVENDHLVAAAGADTLN